MDNQLDALLRIYILEGVAKVAHGAWASHKQVSTGLAMAAKVLKGIDPRWFTLEPQGLLLNLKNGIKSGGPRSSSEDREDVLMTVLGTGADMLYKMGRTLGHCPKLADAVHWLGRHGFHQMTDLNRTDTTHLRILDSIEPSYDVQDDVVPIHCHDEAIQWLREQVKLMCVKAPGKQTIMMTVLDHPDWSGVRVASHLGLVAPCHKDGHEPYTHVYKVIRVGLAELSKRAAGDAAVQKWLDDA